MSQTIRLPSHCLSDWLGKDLEGFRLSVGCSLEALNSGGPSLPAVYGHDSSLVVVCLDRHLLCEIARSYLPCRSYELKERLLLVCPGAAKAFPLDQANVRRLGLIKPIDLLTGEWFQELSGTPEPFCWRSCLDKITG